MQFRTLLTAVILLLLPTTAWSELITPSERVRNSLNVRQSPAVGSSTVGTLSPGDTAELLERVPLWYRIRLNDGTVGFVSKSWSNVLEDETQPAALPAVKPTEEMRIHFFNIGAGTCTVVECPGTNARPMVIDCGSLGGSRTEADISDEDLKERIGGILAAYPDAPDVVLSHGDFDHYSLIPSVLEGRPVNEVWHGDELSGFNADLRTWMDGHEQSGITVRRDFPANWHNDAGPITDGLQCGDANAYVLTVNAGASKNSRSLVVMLEYLDFTAIFTGDAEGETERLASENFDGNLKATVLTARIMGPPRMEAMAAHGLR